MAIQKSIVARNAELDAIAPLANTGYIRIYSGAIPATPETAASGTVGSSDITGTSVNVKTPATSTATGSVPIEPSSGGGGGGRQPRQRLVTWSQPLPPPPPREEITGIARVIAPLATSHAVGQILLSGVATSRPSPATSAARATISMAGAAASAAKPATSRAEGWIVDDARDVLEFLTVAE